MTPEHNAQNAFEFHLEEYKRLVSEIQSKVIGLRDFERFAVLGIAALYAWFFSQSTVTFDREPFVSDVRWIPVAISLLGFFRSYTGRRSIFQISQYLTKIEEVYALPRVHPTTALRGWESGLQSERTGFRMWLPQGGPLVTWLFIVPTTILIAVFWKP